jgi:hypothetical protein
VLELTPPQQDNMLALRAMEHLIKEDVAPAGYTRVIHPWEYLIWRNLQEALHMNMDFFQQARLACAVVAWLLTAHGRWRSCSRAHGRASCPTRRWPRT